MAVDGSSFNQRSHNYFTQIRFSDFEPPSIPTTTLHHDNLCAILTQANVSPAFRLLKGTPKMLQ
jgi:hypothetical protein